MSSSDSEGRSRSRSRSRSRRGGKSRRSKSRRSSSPSRRRRSSSRGRHSPMQSGGVKSGSQPGAQYDNKQDHIVSFSWGNHGKTGFRNNVEISGRQLSAGESEAILETRIIEMRSELGRLMRDNSSKEKSHRGSKHLSGVAHEGRGQTNRIGYHSWTGESGHNDEELYDEKWWPRAETESPITASSMIASSPQSSGHMNSGRFPERERQLMEETEFLHTKLQQERRRSTLLTSPMGMIGSRSQDLQIDPLNRSKHIEYEANGWDCYRNSEDVAAMLILTIDMGTDYSAQLRRLSSRSGQCIERFLQCAAADVAEAFSYPRDLVSIPGVQETEHRDFINLPCEFKSNPEDAMSLRHSIVEILKRQPPRKLHRAAKLFHEETGTPTHCIVISEKSEVGDIVPRRNLEGYEREAYLNQAPYSSTATTASSSSRKKRSSRRRSPSRSRSRSRSRSKSRSKSRSRRARSKSSSSSGSSSKRRSRTRRSSSRRSSRRGFTEQRPTPLMQTKTPVAPPIVEPPAEALSEAMYSPPARDTFNAGYHNAVEGIQSEIIQQVPLSSHSPGSTSSRRRRSRSRRSQAVDAPGSTTASPTKRRSRSRRSTREATSPPVAGLAKSINVNSPSGLNFSNYVRSNGPSNPASGMSLGDALRAPQYTPAKILPGRH